MTHPGEQFYPDGVHWDDEIAQGTVPGMLAEAANAYGPRTVIEFRDRPITYTALEAMVEIAASAFLRAGYGKGTSVALFLGNTPDHPVNFFGALKEWLAIPSVSADPEHHGDVRRSAEWLAGHLRDTGFPFLLQRLNRWEVMLLAFSGRSDENARQAKEFLRARGIEVRL